MTAWRKWKRVDVSLMLFSAFSTLRGMIEHEIEKALDSEKIVRLINVTIKFCHLGNVIYDESPEAPPEVLKDMGANYVKTSEDGKILRDIKYKKFESDNIMDDLKFTCISLEDLVLPTTWTS